MLQLGITCSLAVHWLPGSELKEWKHHQGRIAKTWPYQTMQRKNYKSVEVYRQNKLWPTLATSSMGNKGEAEWVAVEGGSMCSVASENGSLFERSGFESSSTLQRARTPTTTSVTTRPPRQVVCRSFFVGEEIPKTLAPSFQNCIAARSYGLDHTRPTKMFCDL